MEFSKQLILAVKKNELHNGYGLQKECEALVSHVLSNMIKSKLPTLAPEVKNDNDATTYKEEGNQCFVMGDDDDAIEKYTMSLAFSPSKESMAHAFANRSAALYRMQLYRECLIDIDAALSHGYPEEKCQKLKERADKAIDCLKQQFEIKDVNMNNLPTQNVLTGPSPANDNNDDSKKENELSIVKELVKDKPETEGQNEDLTKSEIIELISKKPENVPRYVLDEGELGFPYGPNEEAPSLSKGVQISYSKKYGRHLIATEPFKPGDIVAMEYPYAYVNYREKYYTHCHHCLSRSYNLIPCSKCPIALYCSEECRTTAWKMVHRLECPVHAVLAKLLNVDKDKIRILTKIIRLLLVATKNGTAMEELRKDCEKAEKNTDNRTAGFNDEQVFDSNSARSALSLATNLVTRPPMEISAFACVVSLSIILLATESNFFGKKFRPGQLKNIIDREDVKFCGAIIFRNCVIISSNSFSVQLESGVKVGSGLYCVGSLMNHSCAPNTFRYFEGLKMITRALEPIKVGDQIFTCYGGGYHYMPREERKKKMTSEYFFECDCIACCENWPTYNEILRNHIGSISKNNKELVEKLKPYRQRLLVNKYDIDAVKAVLNILYAEVKMPCEEIVHAVQYLKCYYLGKFQHKTYISKV
ncbi:SET and MYND domain-containing protein 4-like [Phymastichus coffea]|uniref:SET and MYND domain-containing protein 4-like n=1 Tax=Phymastichus coffea TaxID=108790 RepID=UPI00273C641F|nr:SET and MYND domain-containing protein 4-like [Phymastichus coffea]